MMLKGRSLFRSAGLSVWVKVFCILILLGDVLLQPWLAEHAFDSGDIGFYRDLPQRLRVIAVVAGEPDVRSDRQNFVVAAQEIFLPDASAARTDAGGVRAHEVSGKMMVKTYRYPSYAFGDVLDLNCLLETPPDPASQGARPAIASQPPVFEKFSYAALLAKDDIFVLCGNPGIRRVQALEAGAGANAGAGASGGAAGGALGVFGGALSAVWRGFWSSVFTLKAWLIERTNALFSEPTASLAAGILIGARRAIPQKILDDFNTAGLTHVLAISGYNVSMMIAVFGYLCAGAARRWRYAGMLFGVLGLVVLTGFSASVLRAAWMGCIALFAQAVGRKGSALHLLLISGVIMVLLSSRMILVDMSFQLSFLSTLGILIFMPKIEAFEQKLTARSGFLWISKIPAFMREGFCVTLAAQVFTTPLLFYQFGRFSLIAPVANIFVLPLVPWIMLFGFFAIVFSFVFFPLGQLVGFGAYVLVSVMLFLVSFFAGLPFAALQF